MQEDRVRIYTPEDCYDQMLYEYENGKVKGTTTYNARLDAAWTWRLQEFNIWTGYANEGKLLDVNTLIPTPDGWKTMGELQVGDKVFDENGKECNVVGISDIDNEEKCYQIDFLGGESIVCGENHQWVVDNIQSRASKSRQKKRKSTKKRGIDQRYKCLSSQITTCKHMVEDFKIRDKNNYSIDLCNAVEYSKKNLLIPPYVLGCWLGDGSSASQGLTGIDKEIFENIKKLGYEVNDGSVDKIKYIQGLAKELKNLGLKDNKHIPIHYLQSSVEDRLELLKGLMDTDGTIDRIGRCVFNNCNKILAYNVYELMCSLGIKVYLSDRPAKLNGIETGSINYELKFKTDFSVFKLSRKKKRERFKVKNKCRLINNIVEVEKRPLKCIEVDSPNHMYICTKSFIPTHNSLFLKQLCLIKALKEGRKFIFCSPEDFPPSNFFDDMIHTLSGGSTDRDNSSYISQDLYMRCFEQIKDSFYFVYIKPPDNTIERVLEEFQKIIDKEEIYGCIIDPILKFTPSKMAPERDDRYAGYIGTLMVDFARTNNISLHMVMHQNTPKALESSGFYPKPNMYNVKGGGSWNDGVDNLLYVQRPSYAKDKIDDGVIIGSQKIKHQKLVGIPQDIKLKFDRKTNRYVMADDMSDMFYFDSFLK